MPPTKSTYTFLVGMILALQPSLSILKSLQRGSQGLMDTSGLSKTFSVIDNSSVKKLANTALISFFISSAKLSI